MPEMFDLMTLNRAVEKRVKPKRFFTDRFFKPQAPVATNLIVVDKTNLKHKVAPFVSPLHGGIAVEKDGFSTWTLETAYLQPLTVITVEDLRQRAAGQSPFVSSANDVFTSKIAGYLNNMDDSIDRAIEKMAVEAILLGKTVIKGKDVDREINWKRSPENNDYLTTKWSDSKSNKADDIRSWRRTIMKNSGVNPDTLIMGSAAILAFLKDEAISKLFSKSGYDMATFSGVATDGNITYYGFIPEFGHLFTYDEFYYDAKQGKSVPFMDEKKVVYASSNADNRLFFGAINNLHASPTGLAAMERFVDYNVKENGKGGELTIECAPLPALLDADSTLVATVL